MSTVALYDMDMATLGHVLPNLEIMKLSEYYRSKYVLTKFTTSFAPDKYTYFYIRKDYNDHNFPREIFQDNIKFGGYAFTNGIYLPFEEDIESVIPNTDLYKPFVNYFSNKPSIQNLYLSLLRGQHLRLSLNGCEIWDKYEKQLKQNIRSHYIILHDYNINNISNIFIFLQDWLKQNPSLKFGIKFPVQINNSDDLLRWIELPIIEDCFGLQYNGIMPDSLWHEYIIKKDWQQSRKDLIYNITYNCPSEEIFIKEWLPKIYKQLIFSRMKRVRILLKYDDNFFINKEWLKVLRLFQFYLSKDSSKTYNEEQLMIHQESCSMFGFVKKLYDIRSNNCQLNKVDAREIFMFVKENNFQLFDDFYQIAKVKLQGDNFIDDTTRNSSSGMHFKRDN